MEAEHFIRSGVFCVSFGAMVASHMTHGSLAVLIHKVLVCVSAGGALQGVSYPRPVNPSPALSTTTASRLIAQYAFSHDFLF